ncbi:MAG: cysteine-rich CWC family protein [Comamonas sp.]
MAFSAPPSTAPVPVDPLRCPLCGQSNQCAITAGLAPESCWCMTADVAPAALAAIPEAQRRQSCLCPGCAAGQFPGAAPGTDAARS